MSEDTGYSAKNLTVLRGLDAVRKRPAMYIFDTATRGMSHLVAEVFDNSVDEALAGHCSDITVTFHADLSASIHDNGRGIPVDFNEREGLSGVELVFTELHGGGKFGNGAYGASGGLHGVGASVTNALSTKLEVEVDRDGFTHAVTFGKGVPGVLEGDVFTPRTGVRQLGEVAKGLTGTRVRFWPDFEIFEAGTQFDVEGFRNRARQTAFLVPGLKITVLDEVSGARETFQFEGGLSDFIDFNAPDRPVSDTFLFTGDGTFTEKVPMLNAEGKMVPTDVERRMEVEVALRWGTGYEPTVRSFVNIVTTPKGGTHVAGFERALNRTVNEYLKSLKVAKASDENVTKEDIQEGLTAVVLVRIPEPQFEGQTKEILGTSAASKIVQTVVADNLKSLFSDPKRKPQIKNVLEKINQAAKTRKAARDHKETIRRKNALESAAMPAKLRDCFSDDMERTEIFIIEGDSAAGTVKEARDSDFQALMPIRGKILNTMRASEAAMLANAECAAIITAMGGGAGKSFDIDAIRYGKFIILADADVDGSHIRCLLLTLCYRYMLPLLKAGRVYAAMPPLFGIEVVGERKGKKIYTYTDAERDAVVADLEKAGKKVKQPIQRYKGLGEMSAQELHDTTMDIDQRTLRRVTLDDAEGANLMFDLLMGNEVPPRKDYIVEMSPLLNPALLDV